MTADVYVLPGLAGVTFVFPSQPHPSSSGQGGGGHLGRARVYRARRDTDEEILAALGLFNL